MASYLSQLRELSRVSILNPDITNVPAGGPWQDAVSTIQGVICWAHFPEHDDLKKKSGRNARKWIGDYPDLKVEALAVEIFALRQLQGASKHAEGLLHVQTNPENAYSAEDLVENANRLLGLAEKIGLDTSRLCIIIPATIEGFKACEQLHKRDIATSASGIFYIDQAIMAGKVGCKYAAIWLPPYEDFPTWQDTYALCAGADDYYKKFGHETKVMAQGIVDPIAWLSLAGISNVAPEWSAMDLLENNGSDANAFPYFRWYSRCYPYLAEKDTIYKDWGDYQKQLSLEMFANKMTNQTTDEQVARWIGVQWELEDLLEPFCKKNKKSKSTSAMDED
ncbi:MAG: hypothetical protein M1822_001073 [Bathelium mastoideum]|nr:MAG: hypothetical protein M1822_001073 [Bathelium mastoideum]